MFYEFYGFLLNSKILLQTKIRFLLKVTQKVDGLTSDLLLGDPLLHSGALYVTNLSADQIYSASMETRGSATLISIAPKSGKHEDTINCQS